MITIMGYFTKATENEAELDYNTQLKMVFKTLFKDFVNFRATYNLEERKLTPY